MKKILNDLKLKFENPHWALDPEFALIDTAFNKIVGTLKNIVTSGCRTFWQPRGDICRG